MGRPWKTVVGLAVVACSSSPANAEEAPRMAAKTPSSAAAECPEPVRRLEGTYVFAGGEAEREAVEAAITDVVSEMNPFVREIARRRLLSANKIAKKLTVKIDGADVTVAFDERSYTAELGGPAITVTGVTGKQLSLTHKHQGKALVQRFDAAKGGRSNVLERGDDKVRVAVEVRSDQLPKSLKYRLTFSPK